MKRIQEPGKCFQLVLLELGAGRAHGGGVTRAGSVENRGLKQGLETAFRCGKGEEAASSNQISLTLKEVAAAEEVSPSPPL